ncbi:hypothetical protein J2S40_001361 [Nocardioides luteus]|uniref:Uncharacterized protein n=1 Tax=Nocardioides luteus TaxID=1844 RepID=A0ABQ5T1W9_9ACTN|nr:hypothetical protein [Nocardioides luteus]MDR7310303.1 hypothetical protein [Nocardioides luteus]GGR53600.1 hypothetical protein GCM10010197_20020 [Nocardioides luteus]GLJ69918.1 hypothetical protein GCM10017579_39540 [Nocardioides luteus]
MTENEPKYRFPSMPDTRGGRELRKIDGDAGDIGTRADAIIDLGEKMSTAADTLQLFADGDLGIGESLDKIRDQAKEVYEDLRTAGERYTPSGKALKKYAEALDTVQDETDSLVTNAETAWESVNTTSYALLDVQQAQEQHDQEAEDKPAGEGDGETENPRPDSSSEQAAFDAAVSDWESYWGSYDAPVSTWEDAYGAARDDLEEVNENGVEDGFWDNAMPFIEGALKVLQVVGFVALIIAVCLTGPIAALAGVIAVISGVLMLAGELTKFLGDRGSWQGVTLAAIGVIPFGKFASLGKLADGLSSLRFSKIAGSARTWGRALDNSAMSKFGVDAANWVTRHGLNTRNMLRSFTLVSDIKPNTYNQVLHGLCGFKPGQVPASVGDALAGTAQGVGVSISNIVGMGSVVAG